MNLTINLPPITKKNSQQIITIKGRPCIIPSKQYKRYEKDALAQLPWPDEAIGIPVNVRYTFYMGTRRAVDLTNLEEAADDVLVKAGILADDNCNIVAGHDGSRVKYSKEHPRTEIEITEMVERQMLIGEEEKKC